MEKTLFEKNVDILRQTAGKWIDKRLVLLTAAQFAAKQELIDGKEFTAVTDKLKKAVSIFSPLRTITFPITGLLMMKKGNKDTLINDLLEQYETLRSAGLYSSPYTYIAAFLLNPATKPERIKNIYDEMKRYHVFLTSSEDYPAAVIMANRPESAEKLVSASEEYYRFLSQNGFRKGNDLQFLANMLVMNGMFQKKTARLVLSAKQELENNGLKTKATHYPALGVIALSGKPKESAEIALKLKASPVLNWSKDMAIVLASIFTSQTIIDSSAGLTATLQAMVQAQQAVVAASAAGAVSAASSSGS